MAKTLTKEERGAKNAKRDAASDEKSKARRESPRTVAKVLDKDERAKRDAEREAKDQARRDSPRTVAKVLNREERAEREAERAEVPVPAAANAVQTTPGVMSGPASMPTRHDGMGAHLASGMNAAVMKAVQTLSQGGHSA